MQLQAAPRITLNDFDSLDFCPTDATQEGGRITFRARMRIVRRWRLGNPVQDPQLRAPRMWMTCKREATRYRSTISLSFAVSDQRKSATRLIARLFQRFTRRDTYFRRRHPKALPELTHEVR